MTKEVVSSGDVPGAEWLMISSRLVSQTTNGFWPFDGRRSDTCRVGAGAGRFDQVYAQGIRLLTALCVCFVAAVMVIQPVVRSGVVVSVLHSATVGASTSYATGHDDSHNQSHRGEVEEACIVVMMGKLRSTMACRAYWSFDWRDWLDWRGKGGG